jgi:hypothetical protein
MLKQLAEVLAPASLQFDLAAALVALVALIFSVWSFRHQRRISIETLRIQRDNDVIKWTDGAIETVVGIEFLLRNWPQYADPQHFSAKRDDYLAALSIAIDQGRLYFPNFVRDVIEPTPAAPPASSDAVLDHLVDIYDLVKDLDPRDPDTIEKARRLLLLKKRAFMARAQSEVEPQRRLRFLKDYK